MMADSHTGMVMQAWWTRGGRALEAMREGGAERYAMGGALRVSNHETQTHQQVGRPAGANLVEGDGAASAQCHDRAGGAAIAAGEGLVAA